MPIASHTLISKWEPLPAPACKLAESPRFCDSQWFWVDIDGQQLFRCTTADLHAVTEKMIESIQLPDQIGCVLPGEDKNQFTLFGRQGVYQLTWTVNQTLIKAIHLSPFDTTTHRFNDGRADLKGRAWISTLSDVRQPNAALYLIDRSQIRKQYEPLIVGNGLAFSPNYQFMYLADTRQKKIWRFELNLELGTLSHQELFADYCHEHTARPDGATVTANGDYLVAIYEGYRLDRYNPNGQLIEQFDVPLARPTMPCLGGPNGHQLLITAAAPSGKFQNHKGFEHCSLIFAETTLTALTENCFTSV